MREWTSLQAYRRTCRSKYDREKEICFELVVQDGRQFGSR